MGIQGLLPLVNSVTRDGHIKQYSGKKVAIDAYGWLHKGSYSCSADLALGKPTTMYIEFCMQRIKMMQFHGVIPVLVFDGRSLPMKSGTDKERSIRRKEFLSKGKAFWENGNKTLAFECFQKCTDVTAEMAHAFIQVLKAQHIEYVVAPYEADAQLAFLARSQRVYAVVTEDSDLIVFGCPRIFVKMDRDGTGKEVLLSSLGDLTEINCSGWTDETFRQMCILSGCDYLSSVHGIGLKTAHKLVRQFKTPESIVAHLRTDKKYVVPDTYLWEFKRAEMTFRHQRVYDNISKTLIMLNPWDARGMEMLEGLLLLQSSNSTDNAVLKTLSHLHLDDPMGLLDFVGATLSPDIAQGIALGDLNPHTLLPIEGPTSTARLTLETRLSSSSASASAKLMGSFLMATEGGEGRPVTANPFVEFFGKKQRPISLVDSEKSVRVDFVAETPQPIISVIKETTVMNLERQEEQVCTKIIEEQDSIKIEEKSSSQMGSWMATLKSQYSHPLGLKEEKHVKRARSARADLHQLMQGDMTTRLTLKRHVLSPDTPPSKIAPSTMVGVDRDHHNSPIKREETDRLVLSDKLAQFKYKTLCMSVLNK